MNWTLIVSIVLSALLVLSTLGYHRWTRSLRNPVPLFLRGELRPRAQADAAMAEKASYWAQLVLTNPGDVPIFITSVRFQSHRWSAVLGAIRDLERVEAHTFWTQVSAAVAADAEPVVPARAAAYLNAIVETENEELSSGTLSIAVEILAPTGRRSVRLGFFRVERGGRLAAIHALRPAGWATVALISGMFLLLCAAAVSAVVAKRLWAFIRGRRRATSASTRKGS